MPSTNANLPVYSGSRPRRPAADDSVPPPEWQHQSLSRRWPRFSRMQPRWRHDSLCRASV